MWFSNLARRRRSEKHSTPFQRLQHKIAGTRNVSLILLSTNIEISAAFADNIADDEAVEVLIIEDWWHPKAATLVATNHPDVVIVAVLLDPVVRAVLHHFRNTDLGCEVRSLKTAVAHEQHVAAYEWKRLTAEPNYLGPYFDEYGYLGLSDYETLLEPWRQGCSADVFVLHADVLSKDTQYLSIVLHDDDWKDLRSQSSVQQSFKIRAIAPEIVVDDLSLVAKPDITLASRIQSGLGDWSVSPAAPDQRGQGGT